MYIQIKLTCKYLKISTPRTKYLDQKHEDQWQIITKELRKGSATRMEDGLKWIWD